MSIAETIEEDAEHLFPPKPGGMVDTARRRMADEAEQAAASAIAPLAAGNPKLEVPVMERGCELSRARTFSVSTGSNPVVEVLGRDDNRRYAVVMTLDQPVVMSFSEAAADDPRNAANTSGLSANGFVLPVNVPVPVNGRGTIYVTATSSTATRVSVMAFSYTGEL